MLYDQKGNPVSFYTNRQNMISKSVLITSFILLCYNVFFAQSGFPYEAEWKLIDSLMNKKNLPKSALAEVNKLYAAAKKENQEAQWIKAILYQNHLQETDDNRNVSDQLKAFEKEISAAPPRVAAVLKSVEAEQLNQYMMGNRYQIRNRTTIVSDTAFDISTWTADHLSLRIRELYLSSIANPAILMKTSVGEFDPVIVKGNTRNLRPTLYDLLAWRALDYFQRADPEEVKTDDLLLENPELFSEGESFMKYHFSGDTSSGFFSAVKIYQQILQFHAGETTHDAWLDADISRIQFVFQFAQMSDKDSLYMKALARVTSRFGTLPVSAQAWYLQAQWWTTQAAQYDPLKDSAHRYDFVKALFLCGQGIMNSEPSEGKTNCEQLISNIKRKSYELKLESVNIPEEPFRVLVTYKNIHQLYGRLIRLDEATLNSFEENVYNPKIWVKMIHLPVLKYVSQALPETADYQQHRVEIKMDALPSGQYALLTSSDSTFSENAILGLTNFFCSFIAYVQNGQDYFVVNRDSGHPMSNVKIKSFYQRYNNSGSYGLPAREYHTDSLGHFRTISDKRNSDNLKLSFYTAKDYLVSDYFSRYYNNENISDENANRDMFEKENLQDYLFTDRAIYRPGQTVFFKAIIITRDFLTRKYKSVSGRSTAIYLLDVNREKVDSLLLKSNDFGSVNGQFHLPQNLLNGAFYIQDAETGSEKDFSVEEYKRPAFYVEYDSLKGSYRMGDTIQVSAKALTYAGSAVGSAPYVWRVYRAFRFPYPWLMRYSQPETEKEIAHGTSTTDQQGKLNIHFAALPDKSVNSNSMPVYTYRIEAAITDISGETRSAENSISLSDQSFEITSSLEDMSRISKDSLSRIPVTTVNAGGMFVRKSLTLSWYALDGPSRLIRKRYWTEPDQFVLSEKEFIHLFPNDEYQDETDIKSWKRSEPLFRKTDSSNENGFFLPGVNPAGLKSGWWLLEFKAKDLDGKEIVERKYIEITADTKPETMVYNFVPLERITSEPGKTITIHSGSYAQDLVVFRTRQVKTDTGFTYSSFPISSQLQETPINITEDDRGGFTVSDVFIKNNRWYTSQHEIRIPWTNKELQISFQTWRNKTLPGSKESWKIKISGYKGEQVAAELLSSMYDASLDQFASNNWSVPDIYPDNVSGNTWGARNNFQDITSRVRSLNERNTGRPYENRYDALLSFEYGSRMVFKAMNMALQESEVVPGLSLGRNGPSPVEMAKFTPPKIVKDAELEPEAKPPTVEKPQGGGVQIRKNFNETAFFMPDLKTDDQGNVEINFTMPDALTRWKWMLMASTKDLSFGYDERTIVTQKELMVQTNMPRFFREGDTMQLPVKIVNLSSGTMSGTVTLEWLDAMTNRTTTRDLNPGGSHQQFTVSASQSAVVYFPVIIPEHFTNPLLYRVIAKSTTAGAEYSDGEENIIPVLSNRMLVTESLPLNMNSKNEKQFVFEKLLKSGSSATLQNQGITVEYTTNPAWYAVQALPYLMEFPYECAEQTFNRFYANALASHIVQISPAIQAVFEKWKNTDTAALMSNLQKNEELKSALIRETPWVLQASSETQQKKNIALLFDLIKMKSSLKSAMDKLMQMQSETGGFPWFKGGRDDRYITAYIVSGIGRLKKLNAIPADFKTGLDQITKSGIGYLDKAIITDYKKRDKNLPGMYADEIQYLYMRSFFPEFGIPGNVLTAVNYYRKLAAQNWMKQSVYMQGMIALALNRTGDMQTAKNIMASLKENATLSPELGMYWKANRAGYYWQEAPVETEALLVEVFKELHADQNSVDQMKFWLLEQKRTNYWPTTKATADACYALLITGTDWLSTPQNVSIKLGSFQINSADEKSEAGTGYFKKQIPANEIKPDMGNIQVSVNRQPSTVNPSWGSIYWQYFEYLDKITSAQTGLMIGKQMFREINTDKGPVLEAVLQKQGLKPGDKLIMRIVIKSDRDLEYVHLKDMRAACMEPVHVLSGYKWQDGLGYYETTQDASTSFFFDRLPKGNYVFEYPVFITTSGVYSAGISTLQCMYAPEFSAHSEGLRIQVTSK